MTIKKQVDYAFFLAAGSGQKCVQLKDAMPESLEEMRAFMKKSSINFMLHDNSIKDVMCLALFDIGELQ